MNSATKELQIAQLQKMDNLTAGNTSIVDKLDDVVTAVNTATDETVVEKIDLTNTKIDSTNTKLDTLNTTLQSSGGTTLKSFSRQIQRTAPTTAYTAGQVVADVSAAFLPILNVAKANGTGVKIVRVRIQTSDTGCGGKKFNVHLYNEAPTFQADYANFAISYANATKRVGAIPIVMGTGNMNTVGMNDWNQIILNPAARDVYFILESVDGFTPTASTYFQITIDCELSNN